MQRNGAHALLSAVLLGFLFGAAAIPAAAQAPAAPAAGRPAFSFGLRVWGADAAVEYLFPAAPGRPAPFLVGAVGGGRETGHYYRGFAGGDETGTTAGFAGAPGDYAFVDAGAELALGAGLQLEVSGFALRALALYRARAAAYSAAPGAAAPLLGSVRADRAGLFENSMLFGAAAGNRSWKPLPLLRLPVLAGFQASLTLAPAALGNAAADYYRLNASAAAAVQIANARLFRLYLADRAGIDYLGGAFVPARARASVAGALAGSYLAKPGLGGVIRGLADGRFDGALKLYNNVELRAVVPLDPGFAPTLTAYGDLGRSAAAGSAPAFADEPLIASAGLVVGARIQRALDLGYALNFLLAPAEAAAGPDRGFSHGLVVGAHFALP